MYDTKRWAVLTAIVLVAFGGLEFASAQAERTQSILPAANYTITIEASDGATYDLDVGEETLLTVESAPGVRPLPTPEPSLPLVYRGDVTVTLFRRAATPALESPTVVTPTLGIAVNDGSVTIRTRD